MNAYFSSIGTELAAQLPAYLSAPQIGTGTADDPTDIPTLAVINIHEGTVKSKILNLKTNKATGPDEVAPRLLTLLEETMAPPLASLFMSSFKTGVVFLEWKTAKLTTVHKKDDETDRGNNRPLSILSVLSQISESCVNDATVDHVLNYRLLEPSNVRIYGYQPKVPLGVLGKFSTTLESEMKKLLAKFYAVKGSSGSLLGWKTSQDLSLLQTVQQVKLLPSKLETVTPSGLLAEYDDLFHGLGKLNNYQIKLHIDKEVTPIAQPHRRVPFHVCLECWSGWAGSNPRPPAQQSNALSIGLSGRRLNWHPNQEKNTEISVDASPVGLAAILSQVDPKTGDSHVITYASCSLTATEQRYSQTGREALAVVWACERLHLYIYGKPVTVYTDHKPLVSIYGNPSLKLPARIERWPLRLQPYQITVKYRRGEVNLADYLSRHPAKHEAETSRQQKVAEEYVSYLATSSTSKALKTQEIETATQDDATLQAVAEVIVKGSWHCEIKRPCVDAVEFRPLERVKDELTVSSSGNLILGGTRIVVPKSLQDHVINLAHEGHQWLVKTKSLLRERVWFPHIDKLVESKVKSCEASMIATPECKREPLQTSPLPAAPWKKLSLDFAEIPNKEYLPLITDDYSTYPVVEIVKSTAATTVIPKLDKVFSEFGIPDLVKSDNGSSFNGRKWSYVIGEVERFVRTVKKVIKTARLEHKSYKQELSRMLRNYRATPSSDTAIGQPDQAAAKAKMKERADNKRYVKPSAIKEGDIVLVKRDETKKKGDTPHNPIPRTVIETKGSMVTAENAGGVPITRNPSFSRACPTSRPPVKGKRTPTVTVLRCSSMVHLQDATPGVRELVQPKLANYVLDRHSSI
ncbi:Retrovirus-related Pol polyprotein [Stylophora pistillata]|uniref:Retrovirus-related Pol polyprotein n=1 Tax=Stylophora pistillata TaxID=50429 RepID=A0A2B4SNG7_STYPI|nr:Retrovirus-related Pol polyprotein [Stylophora pistillata]